MRSKKRILFVMNTMGRAGAERALVELMRLLDPARYSLYLYVLLPRGEMFGEVPDYVKLLNRKYDERSVLSPGGKLFIARRLAAAALRGGSARETLGRIVRAVRSGGKKKGRDSQTAEKLLRRMLADGTPALPGKFHLAAAYLEGPATWYVAEKVQANRKAAFLHVDYGRAGYTRELDRGCYGSFDRIFAVSEDVRKGFLSVYPEYAAKTGIFLNIINRAHIRRRAKEPGGFTDGYQGIRLLSVGRLYWQKGYDIAARTAQVLKKRGFSFRWYVLGEGEERKNLRKLIRELGLEDTFVLLGASSNPYPYFRQADICVCTSRFEGKSIVIEEAQALGRPVVAAACTGITEQIVSGQDGQITELDPEKLADEIGRLIRDPKLRAAYGQAAYEKEPAYEAGLADFLSLLGEQGA